MHATAVALTLAAISALNIMNDPEAMANHIFIVYVDFLGTVAKVPHTQDVVDAAVLSVNDFATKTNPPDREDFVRFHTPLPGQIRILLRDLRVPWSHPLNIVVPPADVVRFVGYDPSWFDHLQIAVTPTDQPIRPRMAIKVERYYFPKSI
ncbi:hypothetical protein K438DRAFT_1977442 [Mycena galopus ATCC 62051]|nr:hypothetical protein K438DRAFT_1977442 [Mycena galopus ATCC 62051]